PTISSVIFFLSLILPSLSYMIFFRFLPHLTSYIPCFFSCPAMHIILVPPFFGVPRLAYASPPSRIIEGTALSVSTLLMIVGHPYNPTTAGKGGLIRGYPRLPSSDSISADSSPHS